MSGARLCATLADLGYEGWQLLDADSFEWPFQYEETRPLLNFLCTNLRPSNALTLPELLQYNELKAEGKLLEVHSTSFNMLKAFCFSSTQQLRHLTFIPQVLDLLVQGCHCAKEVVWEPASCSRFGTGLL
jgi:HAUS augmin-like complex subunit 3